jgi:YidC/Oxa1 family membrane protein insertase
MDIKTLFLYAAFAIVSFNIWTEWKHEHSLPVQQTNIVETTQQTNEIFVPKLTQSPVENNTSSSRFITIKTDVLDLKIDMQNGDVVNAFLTKFPSTSQPNAQPFELFKQDLQQEYFASTQLVNMQNNQAYPLEVNYTTQASEYHLTPEKDSMTVSLKGVSSNGIQVNKTYTFHKGSYVIDVQYQIHNASASSWKTYLNQQLTWKNPKLPESSLFQIGSFTGGSYGQPGKHRYKKVSFDEMKKQNLDVDAHGGWVAMQQHYFLTAWIPNQDSINRLYTQSHLDKFMIGSVSEAYTVPAQQDLNLQSKLYIGPEDTAVLKTLAPGLDLTVDYGWLWFLSDALFSLMKSIQMVLGNWGWSIVFITILIKLVFFRLSASSYRSMANMRRLQPKLEQLKQRFGDDKAKFSQATMELYKQEKVNPLGGCLPILVQIPVFIALYWVLVESVELRHAPFIFWIKDLSAADPYHVLPLIMGITLLIQQKLNPTPPDPAQAKVMMLMPVFMTILFWGFPAGLVLYWIVNNTLSILQQWWITKKYKDVATVASH